MLILLPPSEGKTPPAEGRPVELTSLTAPEFATMRGRVLDALAAVSARADAPSALGVGPGCASDVERNVHLRDLVLLPHARPPDGTFSPAEIGDREFYLDAVLGLRTKRAR